MVNGVKSEIAPVISGIPQGTVLGPVLFVIYINDLLDNIKSDGLMFADDTKIFRHITSREDAFALQSDIKLLEHWSDKWQLQFHPDKCHVLTLGKLENDDCFGEIGCLFNREYHIELCDDVKPVISPSRKIPIALKDKLNNELRRMKKLGIIEKIHKPTEWLNTLDVIEKPNGKLRVCLDPRPLNNAIKREYYQLPTAEEIMANMKNAKYFTKLDASSGYWQIKVDEQSSYLLAFMTPNGRFKFNRLPFGIHSTSEIYQSEISQIIFGLEGTLCSQDDIIIWGEILDKHNERLVCTFLRIRESGLKLNRSKCSFGEKEITFLGHNLSAEGLKPNHEKITAIRDMPDPTNKQEMQTIR